MEKATVRRSRESKTVPFDWGSLTWYANAELGNSTNMTVGKCVLKAGEENPLHYHPNCSEILVVLEGRIEHFIEGGRRIQMQPGDSINLPANLPHKARNISSGEAILLISFSSAYRETIEL
ncbi:MAG: hypothetical protein DF168_00991 [Candidatus Moanabacter tarae]|uniref:Cupin type-2 domain-containing protein n=1 Tax=Candidatus Moanibacter tarae TaxID=2200854 RepID=A0A2Z4AFN9_9BACT|nr:MAG: hypothetical protein DF168_00991 [Candidatus Moanabacter tarae]|tara:strand:+ start:1488 stop:1850 length:363 start_codon:yes stop_codon:yes gene_type:complete